MKLIRSPKRKANRYPGYDYSSSGYYFVTICTHKHKYWFGEVKDGEMILNKNGYTAKKVWLELPAHYPYCELDEFIFLPNHVHGIIVIRSFVGTGLKPVPTQGTNSPKSHSLSEIVRGFKSFSSRFIHRSGNPNFRWQRSFYDHVIRSENTLYNIRSYINQNVAKWEYDKLNFIPSP